MNTFLLINYIFIGKATAVPLAMDPQNSLFIGPSWIDKGYGTSFGMESRLTQLIYINIGGFVTLTENVGDIESNDQQDWIRLQHSIFAAPGWRVPHRYTDGINWNIIFRAGFACVFTGDANRTDLLLVDPAGLGGLDLYLQKKKFGIRSSSKLFIYQPELTKTLQGLNTRRFQSSLELFWQWE